MGSNAKEIYQKYLKYNAGETFLVGKGTFADNKYVWVQTSKDKYTVGEVASESGNKLTVKTSNGEEFQVEKEKADFMNPPKFDGVEDCAELSYLNEAAVLHNLRKRYESDIIYVCKLNRYDFFNSYI